MSRAGKNAFLTSRITLRAHLASSIGSVKRKLSCYPCLELAKEGSALSYVLAAGKSEGCYYALELERESAGINIYSASSPTYFLREAVLRLLSLMQVLKDDYRFCFEDLYPYLLLVLAGEKISEYSSRIDAQKREELNGAVELLLASRILALAKENSSLKGAVDRLEAEKAKLLVRLAAQRQSDQDLALFAREVGVTEEGLLEAFSGAGRFGYKIIYKSNGRFEVVRA